MRTEFSAKTKMLAFERCKGHCDGCTRKLYPGDYHYDHDDPDGLTGAASLGNCRVLCRSCHAGKTKQDVAKIARAKRRQRRHIGIKKPRTMTRWRKFNQTIVIASRER